MGRIVTTIGLSISRENPNTLKEFLEDQVTTGSINTRNVLRLSGDDGE